MNNVDLLIERYSDWVGRKVRVKDRQHRTQIHGTLYKLTPRQCNDDSEAKHDLIVHVIDDEDNLSKLYDVSKSTVSLQLLCSNDEERMSRRELVSLHSRRAYAGGTQQGRRKLLSRSLDTEVVEIWWELERRWYRGAVNNVRRLGQTENTYFWVCDVDYEDGDKELKFDLSKECWRLASENVSDKEVTNEVPVLCCAELRGVMVTVAEDGRGRPVLRLYMETQETPDSAEVLAFASRHAVQLNITPHNAARTRRTLTVLIPAHLAVGTGTDAAAGGTVEDIVSADMDLSGRVCVTALVTSHRSGREVAARQKDVCSPPKSKTPRSKRKRGTAS